MRIVYVAGLVGALGLGACTPQTDLTLSREAQPLNALDSVNLTDIMLNTADPDAAVEFFRRSLQEEPGRIDFQRGYAVTLTRAGRHDEAVIAFERLDEQGDLEVDDRLTYARSLVSLNRWDHAEAQLTLVPQGQDSYQWNQLNALISDNYERWEEADRFYAAARAQTAEPGAILNNWGVSKMSRGDLEGAARHFTEAVRYDPDNFGAKNNLAISRALRGNYAVPLVPLEAAERAQIYHNMALVALRQDQVDTARGLLELAVETHPQFFPAAADKLAALEGLVER